MSHLGYYQHSRENALKRAEEFYKLERYEEAISTLYSVIAYRGNKRNRVVWNKNIEACMLRFAEICIEQQNQKKIKEGLHHFRNLAQANKPNSLEKVVTRVIDRSERALTKNETLAEKTISELTAGPISDEIQFLLLTAGETPEERVQRELVHPWLNFLWSSYRTVLEVLKYNAKLIHVYKATALRAFAYCKKYERTLEFRRLSDLLRNHLTSLTKTTKTQNVVNLESKSDLETLLSIRLVQLKTASELQLWQEVYRSVEDIKGLMSLSKEMPDDAILAEYFSQLAGIYWLSGNHLFHCNATSKYWEVKLLVNDASGERLRAQIQATKEKEVADKLRKEEEAKEAAEMAKEAGETPVEQPKEEDDDQPLQSALLAEKLAQLEKSWQEEMLVSASRYYLSYICSPDRTKEEKQYVFKYDLERERNLRMGSLLIGYKEGIKSKIELLHDLKLKDVESFIYPELKGLLELLGDDFAPMDIPQKLAEKLTFIKSKPTIAKYADVILNSGFTKTVRQLSTVFQTLKLDRFHKLFDFLPAAEVERRLVQMLSKNKLGCSIDYKNGIVKFTPVNTIAMSISSRLTEVSNSLSEICDLIEPASAAQRLQEKEKVLAQLTIEMEEEHQRMLKRSELIEKRKQDLEAQEKKEKKLKEEIISRREKEQKALAAKLQQQKERERREQERKVLREQMQKAESKAVAEYVMAKTKAAGKGDKVLEDLYQSGQLDAQEFVDKQIAKLEEERKNFLAKLNAVELRMEHMTRAVREAEIPLLKNQYEAKKEEDRKYWEKQRDLFLQKHRAAHEREVQEKQRFANAQSDADAYKAIVMQRRRKDYEARKAERDKQVEKLLAERAERNKNNPKKTEPAPAPKPVERAPEPQRQPEPARAPAKTPKKVDPMAPPAMMNPSSAGNYGAAAEPKKQLPPGRTGRAAEQLYNQEVSAADEDDAWRKSAVPRSQVMPPDPRSRERDGPWRRDGPPRDARGMPRDPRGMPRDPRDMRDGPGPRGPPRDERRWGDGPRGPPREERGPPRSEEGPWRRGGAPARRELPRGDPRGDPRGPRRDPRDDPRGPPRRDEGPWRRDGPARRDPRDDPRGPRRDFRRDPRDDPRGDPRGPRRDPRDDPRGPPRSEEGPWRRSGAPARRELPRDRPPPRGGDDNWRRGAPARRDPRDGPPPRGDRGPRRDGPPPRGGDDNWRRGGPPGRRPEPNQRRYGDGGPSSWRGGDRGGPRREPPRSGGNKQQTGDDGWTTVPSKNKR